MLLAHDGQVVFHEARGLASSEYNVPNRPDTRFNLGSINKLFTRVAIGQLAEKGSSPWTTRSKNSSPTTPTRRRRKKSPCATCWT